MGNVYSQGRLALRGGMNAAVSFDSATNTSLIGADMRLHGVYSGFKLGHVWSGIPAAHASCKWPEGILTCAIIDHGVGLQALRVPARN